MAGAFLWRVSPRVSGGSLAFELTQRVATQASSYVVYEYLFGLFGANILTGQSQQTADAVAWITNYPFTYQVAQTVDASGLVTTDATVATTQAQSTEARRLVPAKPAFTVLDRAAPRQFATSFVYRFAHRYSASVYADVAADRFFGVFGHNDSQQAQTVDLIGDVVTPPNAVFLTFQGQTIDGVGLVKVDSVVATGQGQTVDVVTSSPIDAVGTTSQGETIDGAGQFISDSAVTTGQGQSVTSVMFMPIDATIALAQGQTIDSVVIVPIDAAIGTTQGQTIDAAGQVPLLASVTTAQAQTVAAAGIVTPMYVVPVGFSAFADFGFGAGGSGWISFLDRTIAPAGLVATAFGTALADDVDRTIPVASINDGAVGTAFVSYLDREIIPLFIPATSYGFPVVDQTHFVAGAGFADDVFGTANVHDNTQTFFLSGFDASGIGAAVVTPNPRPVAPVGFTSTQEFTLPSERWGLPTVYNSTQIVTQLFEVTPSDGGVFGDEWNMLVANVNRTVGEIGWPSLKFGRPEVALLDQAAAPEGDDLSLFGNQLVAYRIRTMPLVGIDAGQVGEYTVVFNNARLVIGTAGDQSSFGRPSVVNTRRYYQNVTAQDVSAFGVAFVAFAIRTVTVPLGPESVFGTAFVDLATKHVTPDGISADNVSVGVIGQWGLTDVVGHRNIVAPSWVFKGNFINENGSVLNRNREVDMYGLDQADYGHATVFNIIQYVAPEGDDMMSLGVELAVARRTRIITVLGLNAGDVPQHARAAKTTPDPPAQQTITDASAAETLSMGNARAHGNTMLPIGIDFSAFGNPNVHSNVIFVPSINDNYYDPANYGLPSLNYPQTAAPAGIPAPDELVGGFPVPRLSPLTIYATTAVPLGYTPNGPTWEPVDQYLSEDPSRPLFGTPGVDYKNRRYQASGVQDDAFGEPAITLGRQFALPLGILSLKMGYPATNGAQFIDMQGYNLGGETFGATAAAHIVIRPNPWPVVPTGFDASFVNPNAQVDFFNRTRAMVGWDSFTMSSPVGYDSRFFGPLSTRVHFPEPTKPPGIDAAAFGTQWVSFRVRTLDLDGFETLQMGPTTGDFADHMRVTRRNYVRPSGFDASAFGGARVVRHNIVRPLAIADGAFGLPRKHQSTDTDVSVSAIFDGDFGVDTTTHGDNLDFVCGQASRAIPPQGFGAGAIGAQVVTHG